MNASMQDGLMQQRDDDDRDKEQDDYDEENRLEERAILLLVLEVICLFKFDAGHGAYQIPVSDNVKLNVLKSVNVAIQFILYPHLHFLERFILRLQYPFPLKVQHSYPEVDIGQQIMSLD